MALHPAITARGLCILVEVLAALGVVMALGTWLFVESDPGPAEWEQGSSVKWVLLHLSLGEENVVASWFSSMLMLVAAALAATCFLAVRWRGWLVAAVLFSLLSLDELGSLHERVESIRGLDPISGAAPGLALEVVLATAVAVVLAAFAVHIRRSRRAAILFVVGLFSLFTVPLYETLSEWLTGGRSVGFLVAEEVAEIVAMLALVAGLVAYLTEAPVGRLHASSRHLALGIGGLVAGAAIALLATDLLVRYAPAGDNGIPHNWFPSALAAVAAALAMALWAESAGSGAARRGGFLAAAAVGLAVSVFYGANIEGWVPVMGETAPALLPWLKVAMVVTALAAALALSRANPTLPGRLASVAFPIILAAGLIRSGNVAGPLELAASSALLYSLGSWVVLVEGERPEGGLGSAASAEQRAACALPMHRQTPPASR